MAGAHIPSTRIEGASASGGLALRQAYIAVAGGFIDVAVVGGAAKMTDVSDSESAHTLAMGAAAEGGSPPAPTFASPPAAVAPPRATGKAPPESGHGSQMIAAAAGQLGGDDFGEFSYRLTYHDLLDNSLGFPEGAQIQGLGLTVRSTESGAPELEELQLVGIRSFSPRDQFAKPLSWYVEGGLERAWAGRRRLVRYLQGGAGASWRYGGWQPYLLASARAENNSEFSEVVTPGGGGEAGMLYHAGRWQWQLSTAGHYFTNDVYRHRSRLAVQYALSQQQGLRAQVEREGWRGGDDTEFKLQWRWYYD